MERFSKTDRVVYEKCSELNWDKRHVFNPVTWNEGTNSPVEQMPVPFTVLGGAEYFYSMNESKTTSSVEYVALWRIGYTTFNSEVMIWKFKKTPIKSYVRHPKTRERKPGRIDLEQESISWTSGPINCIQASKVLCTYTKIKAGEYHERAKKLLLKMSNLGQSGFQSMPTDLIKFD